jgi:hypothetical protein
MDRCGLCPQRAVTAWWQADFQLERSLCAHHARSRGPAMLKVGWQLVADERAPA